MVAEQVPPALAMRPDLVSFAAGGNDVLRRSFDPRVLVARFDPMIERLRATGADVVLFRLADVTGRLPGRRIVAPAGRRAQRPRSTSIGASGTARTWSTCSPTTRSATHGCGASTGCTCRRPGTAGSPGTC